MGLSTSNEDGFPEHAQDDPEAEHPEFKERNSSAEDFSEDLDEVLAETADEEEE